ncbi:lysR substrate binding domain protein [Bordetella holmesii ATCC 51541]|nr:lysR substrate binding domain protein [Bordetella holmesii ATCC 51541]
MRLRDLTGLPLLLPSDSHGLRALVNNGFARFNERPDLVAEIDGLDVLMELVEAGLGATIQPGAATVRLRGAPLATRQIRDRQLARSNLLVSLSDDELSPAALAVRVLLAQVAADLVRAGAWPGATLHKS